VEGAQLRAGVGAEALREGAAGGLVRGEGVGFAAGVAQGADEEDVQRFVVRVYGGQFAQFRYDVRGAAEP
jgi:hypothetical protein